MRDRQEHVLEDRGDITEDIVIRLSRVVGSTPQFWLNMQTKRNLWQLEQKNKDVYKDIKRLRVA